MRLSVERPQLAALTIGRSLAASCDRPAEAQGSNPNSSRRHLRAPTMKAKAGVKHIAATKYAPLRQSGAVGHEDFAIQ